jgi:hypothetical protein
MVLAEVVHATYQVGIHFIYLYFGYLIHYLGQLSIFIGVTSLFIITVYISLLILQIICQDGLEINYGTIQHH